MLGIEMAQATAHIVPFHHAIGQLETPVRLATFGFKRTHFRRVQQQCLAVINKGLVALTGGFALPVQLPFRFITRIEQPFGFQLFNRNVISVLTQGLAFFTVPVNTQPAQILADGIDIFILGTYRVGIIEPQDKFAAMFAGIEPVHHRDTGIADMKQAGRAGGKT